MDDVKDDVLEVDSFKKELQEFDAQKDDSQIQEKVPTKKRRTGTLERIKGILNGKDLSIDEVYSALNDVTINKGSVMSMLSQYVSKGVFVRTEKGYTVKK